jgi:uncharacterized protein with NRDE domain
MCLIVFAWHVIPGAPLIAAANRDEFYARPTAAACNWEDQPQIFAGRDLQAGGTWMGISQNGANTTRFAAITNVRAPDEKVPDAPTRGMLVANFLAGSMSPQEYVAQITSQPDHFNGFNLLLGDEGTLVWYSNRGQADPRNGQPLAPGIYGLSNSLLDTPWPKVVRAKAQFGSLLCQAAPDEAYFEMLSDTARARDVRLPNTGVELEWERVLSPICIESPTYGTRSSTLLRMHAQGPALLAEKVYR